jgi:hypothetical protein
MYFKFMRISTNANKLIRNLRFTFLTALLVFTTFLTLFAYRGGSQPLHDVRLSVELYHVSLKKSLSIIEEKTNFKFIYNAREIANENNVTLVVTDHPWIKCWTNCWVKGICPTRMPEQIS